MRRLGAASVSERGGPDHHQGAFVMQIAMIGLGRMGGNMVLRLTRGGHSCVVYDRSADAVKNILDKAGGKAVAATSLQDVAAKLTKPRAVCVMLPAGPITEVTVAELG